MSDFFQQSEFQLEYDESKVPEVSFAQKIGLTYDGSGEDPSDRWGLKIAYYMLFVLLVVCMVNLWFENIRRLVLGAYVADCLLFLLLYFMFRPYMTFRLKFRGDPDPRLDMGFLLYVGGLFPALNCLFLAWHDDMLITLTNKAMFYSISLGVAGVLILLYFLLSLEKKKIYITILFMVFAVIFSLTSVYLLNYIFDMGAPYRYEIIIADKKNCDISQERLHAYL